MTKPMQMTADLPRQQHHEIEYVCMEKRDQFPKGASTGRTLRVNCLSGAVPLQMVTGRTWGKYDDPAWRGKRAVD